MEPIVALPIADALAERVEYMIRVRSGGAISHLKVVTLPGEVVLAGVARTYYAKQLATHTALDACSGMQVVNEIEVH